MTDTWVTPTEIVEPIPAGPFAELANAALWVGWRYEERNGKQTKVPVNARTGGGAMSNEPGTWGTRAAAETCVKTRNLSGIGINLADIGGGFALVGIDLDTCRSNVNGDITDWAREVIERIASYTEVSPSETGYKVFFKMRVEDRDAIIAAIRAVKGGEGDGIKWTGGAGEHPPAIELFARRRYFTVTEEHLEATPCELRVVDADTVRWVMAVAGPALAGRHPVGIKGREEKPTDESRSGAAYRKGLAMRRAGSSFEEMCTALRADPDPEVIAWVREKGEARAGRGLRRIWEETGRILADGVTLEDFWAYMPGHSYIFAPTRAMWPGASVNARIPPVVLLKDGVPEIDEKGKPLKIAAAAWLDRHRPVEQMTWAPGEPTTIPDRLIATEGGWIDRKGVTCFNLYYPPIVEPGDAAAAGRWLDHVRLVYPDDAEHIVDWLAHRVQRPQEKINHALVLGGSQGIGKDTLLEPVKEAVGPWNCQEVSPEHILGRFNGFLKSVILRVSEARDLGEFNRFQLYDHMKTYTAAPPDVLRVDEKHLREHPVINCCGVIITTNYKTDGIYLPADDRRHYVAWSDLTKEDERFADGYWRELWGWYANGGTAHVAALLLERDLSGFDPKAPPPKTPAFWEIVDANRPPEEPELADVLDRLGNPKVVRLDQLQFEAFGEFYDWISDRKNRRVIPHRLEKCGYVPVRNPDAAADGQWRVNGARRVIYALKSLSLREQIAAAAEMIKNVPPSVGDLFKDRENQFDPRR